MAFGDADPQVLLLDIETGQRQNVGNFPGMTFSPRFSPDGAKVIMSLSKGSNSNLYVMNIASRNATRLTDDGSIDTSPCYSPDGSQITFESDRGGSQQIYVMGGGRRQRQPDLLRGRALFDTGLVATRGDYIAFTKQKGGQFGIGIMKPDGSGEKILTEGFPQRGPHLGAERALSHVFPRPRQRCRLADLHDGSLRARRVSRADAGRRLGSGLGTAPWLRRIGRARA